MSKTKLLRIQLNESHNERTSLDTYQPFKTRLQNFGKVVVRGASYRPITPSQLRGKALLIVGAPEAEWIFGHGADQWNVREISAIKKFVDRDGGLLVMGDGMGNEEKLSALTAPYDITFSEDWVPDDVKPRLNIFDA